MSSLWKKLLAVFVVLIIIVGSAAYLGLSWYEESTTNNLAFFESEIVAFEEADEKNFPALGSIVFTGSSSIRFWDTLAEDMAPLPTVRRGFGGAHMSHVIYNFDRVITPYQPKAVVVFVGGNDMGSGKSAEHLIGDYQKFVDKLETTFPEADLWILSMKPSKLRWALWPEMEKVDQAFKSFAEGNEKITFVETGRTLLNDQGEPDDVYIFDGLHLNDEGYRRWTQILKPLLVEAYLESAEAKPIN